MIPRRLRRFRSSSQLNVNNKNLESSKKGLKRTSTISECESSTAKSGEQVSSMNARESSQSDSGNFSIFNGERRQLYITNPDPVDENDQTDFSVRNSAVASNNNNTVSPIMVTLENVPVETMVTNEEPRPASTGHKTVNFKQTEETEHTEQNEHYEHSDEHTKDEAGQAARDSVATSVSSWSFGPDFSEEEGDDVGEEEVKEIPHVLPPLEFSPLLIPESYLYTTSLPSIGSVIHPPPGTSSRDHRRSTFIDPNNSNPESASNPENQDLYPKVYTTDTLSKLARCQTTAHAMASYSLTKQPKTMKEMSKMARLVDDPKVQFGYATYLLTIASLFKNIYPDEPHFAVGNWVVPLLVRRLILQNRTFDISHHRLVKHMLTREGVMWMRRLAKKDYPQAIHSIAMWKYYGLYGYSPSKKNQKAAVKLFIKAGELGCPDSHFMTGKFLLKEGKNDDALAHFQQASSAGHIRATYHQAELMLTMGLSMKEALDLLVAASCDDRDDSESPYLLALLLTRLHREISITDEMIEQFGGVQGALSFFKIAAEKGHIDAIYCLGRVNEHGRFDQPINLAKSFYYYKLAAKGGHAKAMLGLSRLYVFGSRIPGYEEITKMACQQDVSKWIDIGPLDEMKALMWCKRSVAVNKTNADALFLLGWYYESGIGTLRDYEKAIRLYNKAAEAGHEGAIQQRQKSTSITRQQHEFISTVPHISIS